MDRKTRAKKREIEDYIEECYAHPNPTVEIAGEILDNIKTTMPFATLPWEINLIARMVVLYKDIYIKALQKQKEKIQMWISFKCYRCSEVVERDFPKGIKEGQQNLMEVLCIGCGFTNEINCSVENVTSGFRKGRGWCDTCKWDCIAGCAAENRAKDDPVFNKYKIPVECKSWEAKGG